MRLSEVHAAESVAYLNKALFKLRNIWDEMGVLEDQRLLRTNRVHKHIKNLLDVMILEEEEHKRELLENIESHRKEIQQLCSELQMPPFEEAGCSMVQVEKNSRTHLELMREQKRQRMDDLKSLVVKDGELCDIMCCALFGINQDSVPSLQQLDDYRAHIEVLTKEKESRQELFVSLKRDIIACMDDLERQAETDFEKDVIHEHEESFCLSTENIKALKCLLHQLEECKKQNEVLCATLRKKIQELWERLKIPLEERENLSEHMIKSKKKNIEALQAEVKRLELLKHQSIKQVVEDIRAEISLYWESCFYSQEQRTAFLHYQDDNFTEELLNLHEIELKTVKDYFEDHQELFEGITKWQKNWALYLELDRKANDPSRFHNRGGNLLKEEKQRSDLQKSLPKLEKILKAQIDTWEHEHGKEFFVNGQKFLDYVQQQWEQHHIDKEKEKMERQLKKSKQTQEDMLYGTAVRTPFKRHLVGTPTPSKQRKVGTATFSTPSSVTSGLGVTLCQGSIQRPPPSASKGARNPGRALERNKENHNSSTQIGALRSQDTLNAIAGSYSEFARDLSEASKTTVRSGQLNSTVSQQ